MNGAGTVLQVVSRSAAIFVLATAALSGAQTASGPYRAATPAGAEVIQLKPSGAIVTLLGLVECQEIAGAQQVDQGLRARVVRADGEALESFPRHFSFRVTATLRKTLLEEPGTTLKTDEDPLALLVKLRFRLKAYDGLHMRMIEPESTRLIGVPADVPYDERIYRVTFNLPADEPATERFVLEVMAPEGERLARLHFSLL